MQQQVVHINQNTALKQYQLFSGCADMPGLLIQNYVQIYNTAKMIATNLKPDLSEIKQSQLQIFDKLLYKL